MPFTHRRRAAHTTTVAPRRRGLFSRRARPVAVAPAHHGHGHAVAPAPVHHHHHHHTTVVQKRKPTFGDKVSGALLKLRGSLTRRPGLKAAGTRRMHGTDGRGSRRGARI